jgi:hypothetical protein
VKHSAVLRAAVCGFAILAFAGLSSALAQTSPARMPAAVVQQGYKMPRLSDGQPDLQGVWTNASLTKMERARQDGDKLEYTAAEMAELEKNNQARNVRQNAPTPKDLQENWTKVAGAGPDKLDECRSGAVAAACGYNAGWTDPGDWIMRVNGKGRTSMITYPKNGRVPPRIAGSEVGRVRVVSGGEESASRGAADGPEDRSLGERCIIQPTPGPPIGQYLYNNMVRVVQSPGYAVIQTEMINDARIVPIGGKHRSDGVKPYMGDSIGWWDGDTLVVETVGFNPRQNIRGSGPNVKVTERFTRVGEHRLHYAFDVEDKDTWAEPWGGEFEFASVDGEVYEYACHEGNYGLEGILAGARAEDRAKLTSDKKKS